MTGIFTACFDGAGERHLIARPDRNLLRRREAAARHMDRAAAARLQRLREGDRLLDVPAAGDPVGARDAHGHRPSAGKAARTASKTSSGNRIRFSSDPPYSSSRRFDSGERN